jgi:ribosome-binding factor A
MEPSEISTRQLKVGDLIKLALIEALRKGKVKDPRLFDANVTVTNVKVSADLQIANCYIMPFTSKLSEAELMDAFEQSKYQLRGLVTSMVQLKFSPELRFFYDKGLENAHNIDDLLNKVLKK